MKQNPMFVILLLVGMLAGCSNDPKNADTNNTTSSSNNMADAGNNGVDVDNTGAEYAMQYQVLFDSLAFTTQPANQLNTLLNANFDLNLEYPILVMLNLTDIDAEAGSLTLEGGSGLKTDTLDEYIFDPESDSMGAAGTLNATTGEFEANLEYFGFVATFVFEDMPSKTILPINNLAIGGQLDLQDDGTANVVNGTLAGYMTKEDGDTTLITLAPGGNPISITQVFKETTLNYDTTTGMMVDPGMGDAWFLAGTFTAQPTTIVE